MRRFFKKDRPEPRPEPLVGEGSRTSATILIVDDSPTETHILKGILEQGGYRVITAQNGDAGIAEANASRPDLILMDVVMPGMNGFQATRQLSRSPETQAIPIIMVTTKAQDTDRAWGLRQGARDYVVKPVTSDELLTKVRSALGM